MSNEDTKRFDILGQWNSDVQQNLRMTHEEWMRNPIGPPPPQPPTLEEIQQAIDFLHPLMLKAGFDEGFESEAFIGIIEASGLLNYLYRCRLRELESSTE